MSLQPSVGGGSSPRKGKYELIGGSLQAEEHGTVGEGTCVGTGSIRHVRERPGQGWGGLQIEDGIGPGQHAFVARQLDVQRDWADGTEGQLEDGAAAESAAILGRAIERAVI